jgi:hypothetical protein
MKNLIFVLLIALSLFLALYYYRQNDLARTELALANQRILDRDRLIYNNQMQLNVLKNKNKSSSATRPPTVINPSSLGSISAGEIARLQRGGLTNPELDLREDLISKQNILLPKGSLGGTMAIRDVKILTDRYALAYFEDGHNGGYILLRFSIESDKRIAWKVLDYYSL